jgi:predicted O-linked N-acetylglucosamine transferase (SPINDLY family)
MDSIERAKALFFEGIAHFDAKSPAAAEASFRAALAIVPDRVSVIANLAIAVLRQDRVPEAVDLARRAVAIDPQSVDAWLVLGMTLTTSEAFQEAAGALDHALMLMPTEPRALIARAALFTATQVHGRAAELLETAMRIDPSQEGVLARLASARRYACDWRDYRAETDALLAAVRSGQERSSPFMLLSMPSLPADQLSGAQAYLAGEFPPMPPLWRGERYDHDRIRVAYVSGDFRRHPMTQVVTGLLEAHDRAAFEVVGVSWSIDDESDIRRRVVAAFDRFVDMRGRSGAEIAAALRDMETDIAVDLGGLTTGGRPSVFLRRPAPVQVNFVGYPATVGDATIADYIIADRTVIPEDERRFFAEQVVWMPSSYFPVDDRRAVASGTPSRAAAGLPEGAFVFCCFNNAYKITPEIFDTWMAILRDVPESVLWLLESTAAVPANLRREASARGIEPSRLVFAPPLPVDQHIARHRLADLFLDTLYYNAHTTACDALLMDVPVVTTPGAAMAGRVATSLLRAVGLDDLVTASLDDYRHLAVRLARDRQALAALKARLAASRATAPLFDTARYTRHLESAYRTMMARHRRGEPPAAFTVSG